ncbi:ISAHY-like protein [Mya arenaria]|uniref:ISAHY-like protein n=1 Tax=Mya arenaria TaxID=6604 RepID=A0ABY7GAM1_MYAAR|nr:ISAHY-like protein [Mya arenaria]
MEQLDRNMMQALSVVTFLLGFAHAQINVIDLTHSHDDDAIYWPGNPQYESNSFATAEHGGTHIDAPSHFAQNRNRVDQIPISRLVGPGVVINVKYTVKDKAAADPDYRVTMEDLNAWEDVHGRIPAGAIVLMNSGWSKGYPNKTLVFGTKNVTQPSTFHFPGFHESAVDWLVKNRNIHVVGVDTPSTDYGQSTTYPVHVILGEADIAGVENVAYLDLLPESGSIVYVAAIKLHDGSGVQARVFATTQPQGGTTGAAPKS